MKGTNSSKSEKIRLKKGVKCFVIENPSDIYS